MNILRQNFYSIVKQRKGGINKDILKTAFNFTRHKSDTREAKSETVSLYDLKITGKTEKPTQTLRKDGIVINILRKIPYLKIDELRLKHAGYMLYEDFVDTLDYGAFFEEYALNDTFYSWFTVTELHIWMLATRAMAEGEEGVALRNALVECLWVDVTERMKSLGELTRKLIKDQIHELSEQLQAAFLGYDEGLQSDDVVLAGALWRRMYQMEEVHPEYLEKLVKYVRKNLVLLDNTSSDNLLRDKHVNWSSR